jgi:hypothetical protein
MMTMLLSFLALALDLSKFFYIHHQLQTLADAAAMAGALEISSCGGTSSSSSCLIMQKAATTALTEGGSATPTLFVQCATASGTGLLLTINNGPCALGTNDPNNGLKNYVETVVSLDVPSYFEGIFSGSKTLHISARSEAGYGIVVPSKPACSIATGGGQDMTLNGGSVIKNAPGSSCAAYSDSPSVGSGNGCGSTAAVMLDGTVDVPLEVAGNVCNQGTASPAPTTGVTSVPPDPFKGLTPPTAPALSSTCCNPVSGTTTLKPGLYNSNLNTNGGNYTVTFAPGLYYFDSSVTFSNSTVTGTGVTFVFAPGAGITFNGGGTSVTLSAPAVSSDAVGTVESTGAINGMLIWQPSTSGDGFILDPTSPATLNGAIYIPNGQLQINGSSTLNANGNIVAQSLNVDATLVLNCSGMPNATCAGGGGGGGGGGGAQTISLAE